MVYKFIYKHHLVMMFRIPYDTVYQSPIGLDSHLDLSDGYDLCQTMQETIAVKLYRKYKIIY